MFEYSRVGSAILKEQLNGIHNLNPGDISAYFGNCIYCGKIEQTEGSNHPYFDDNGKFISRRCYDRLFELFLELNEKGKLKETQDFT